MVTNSGVMQPCSVGYLAVTESFRRTGFLFQRMNSSQDLPMCIGEVYHRAFAGSLEDRVCSLVVFWSSDDGLLSAGEFHTFPVALLKPCVGQHQTQKIPPHPRPMIYPI